MQESLLPYRGMICQVCGKPSKDHIYHQVMLKDNIGGERRYDIYLCTECYKAGKAKQFE